MKFSEGNSDDREAGVRADGRNKRSVRLTVRVMFSSEKGVRVDTEKPKIGRVWIPKSQVRHPDPKTLSDGETVEIHIPYWLADNEGLLEMCEEVGDD